MSDDVKDDDDSHAGDVYSVFWWDPDDRYYKDCAFVSPERAVERAIQIARSVGGRLGMVRRVMITDGGDSCAWEWIFEQGIVFPDELKGKASVNERPAFLCFNDWAGYGEVPIYVVGETPKRFRIRADKTIRLAGRGRSLQIGTTTLVPKTAVRFPCHQCNGTGIVNEWDGDGQSCWRCHGRGKIMATQSERGEHP